MANGWSSGKHFRPYCSLARHTPQSKGKRGLVTMRTASCTSARKPGATNQIQDFEFIA